MEILKARKGYLTILKGRPCTGKTTAAILDMLNRAVSNEHIMYFTIEYSPEDLYRRLMTYFDFDPENQTAINIVDLYRCAFPTLINVIRSEKPSFVYIDYCEAVTIGSDIPTVMDNRETGTIIVCEELSRIAKELDIGIVLLQQESKYYKEGQRVETIYNGPCGFKKIAEAVQSNYIIPMLIDRETEKDPNKCTLYSFDQDGKYERYSEFNLEEIYQDKEKNKQNS